MSTIPFGRATLRIRCFLLLSLFCAALPSGGAADAPPTPTPASAGVSDGPVFPVGVWLQPPELAATYKAIGINFYMGLWQGPTPEQVARLEAAKMPFLAPLNDYARRSLSKHPLVLGWLLPDEPDNAQPDPAGGFGPPTTPEALGALAKDWRAADPARPLHLNLGMGAAYDGYIGRGARTNHPEDYPAYAEAADSLSFDIYPISAGLPAIAGQLEYIALGVLSLRDAVRDAKPVWFVAETARVGTGPRATPEQLRASVWLALTAGARGIVYFAHEFVPSAVEAGLLAHPEIRVAVEELNRELQRLAPLLLAVERAPGEHGVEIAGWRLTGLDMGDPQALFERPAPRALISVRDLDDGIYLMVSSLSGEAQNGVRLSLAGLAQDMAEGAAVAFGHAGGEGRPPDVALSNGEIVLNLPPYATRVYRLPRR